MRRTVRLSAALVLLAALALGSAALWVRGVALDRRYPAVATTLVIPNGATGRDVAQLLARQGIISSAFVFDLLARIEGQRSAMRAGAYRFSAHLSASEVLAQVVTGGRQVARWVTIPEGFTAREIAHTFAAASLGAESALDAAFFSESLRFDGARTIGLEGFLFPETYLVPTSATPNDVARLLTGQFMRELPADASHLARGLGLTIPQIVTLASLVEREAQADHERPLMAGVYYNRLRRGMPLQVDATIEYTFAHHKNVITYADLARDSPYNTYRNAGLPPTPIANPGRASLLAAFHPQRSDFYYYVAMGNGHSAFSRTLAEHNANVARYLK